MRSLVLRMLGTIVAVLLLLQQPGRAQTRQDGDGLNSSRITSAGTFALRYKATMATTLIGSTYRTKDTLRPSGISTYDTGGSSTALDRMPTSFVYNGSTFPCGTTVFVDGRGNRRLAFCSDGRYVLGTSHGGAINEAVSDMFGTSVRPD